MASTATKARGAQGVYIGPACTFVNSAGAWSQRRILCRNGTAMASASSRQQLGGDRSGGEASPRGTSVCQRASLRPLQTASLRSEGHLQNAGERWPQSTSAGEAVRPAARAPAPRTCPVDGHAAVPNAGVQQNPDPQSIDAVELQRQARSLYLDVHEPAGVEHSYGMLSFGATFTMRQRIWPASAPR